MRRLTTISAAALSTVLLSASVAAAQPEHPGQARDQAAKQCHAEKKADKVAFKSLYGKHAQRECIKAETPTSRDEAKNAAQECKSEQAADPEGFQSTYGTDEYSSDAFGKCVSGKVKAEDNQDVDEFDNAAQECKAERSQDADAFKDTYGTKGQHNALGKCVSGKVKDAEDQEPTETA